MDNLYNDNHPNLKRYFGDDCSRLCESGVLEKRLAENVVECVCEPCYSGNRCQMKCNEHGKCLKETCICDNVIGSRTKRMSSTFLHLT